MNKHTMTDAEVIKALKICGNIINADCKECSYDGKNCVVRLIQSTNDLIKRQQAKNKELDEKLIIQKGLIDTQKAEIEGLEYIIMGVMHSVDKWLDGDELKQDEVNRAATMREKTLQITEKQQAEIERLQSEKAKLHKLIPKMIKDAKSEAIKEFAERLRLAMGKFSVKEYWEVSRCISNLVKEMTEVSENG